VIRPLVEDFRRAGLDANPEALASDDPTLELVRLAGCADPAELNHLILRLYDAQERSRILGVLAREWRRQLRLIGVLVRAAPREPRSATRMHADEVDAVLSANPAVPTDLQHALPPLLPGAANLQAELAQLLIDEVTASPPDRRVIDRLLRDHGLDPARLDEIERVLAMPARAEARRLRSQMDQLATHSVRVAPPAMRTTPPLTRRPSRVIPTIHVGVMSRDAGKSARKGSGGRSQR
jgi:hypothetical protein